MNAGSRLPVVEIVPDLVEVLATGGSAVVTAPPGTGKSTAMPCALLDLLPGRLFVTQPRRLAARMLASRSAALRGVEVGDEVGYAVRGDRRQGASTRLLYLTEGLLLRRLLLGDGGPGPGDVVILDEFHERSIDADLLLGVLRARGVRVVVASATLDSSKISTALEARTLSVEARVHPVDVSHRRAPSVESPWLLAAEALATVLTEHAADDGDVLVFMPGRREIERTIEACRRVARGLELRPLHGGLSAREQDLAVSPHGPRRVVVATNIAETSLTIPRVTTVIDSGLARVDRFDPDRDLAGLVTEPIDRASAEQRAGRAGRVRPGRCVRLYTESEFRRRPADRTPATARADLADAFLRLHAAGFDPATFPWIESPPSESAEHARRTLASIGAISGNELTEAGRRMSMLPIPPRVARFLLDAVEGGGGDFAIACAAVLAEREIVAGMSAQELQDLRDPGDPEGDLAARGRLLLGDRSRKRGVDDGAASDARRTMEELRRQLGVAGPGTPVAILPALLSAFPDRVAFRRARDRDACSLPGRRHAVLDRDSLVRSVGFLVAASVRAVETRGEGKTVLGMATAIPEEIALALLEERLGAGRRFEFDESTGRMDMIRFRTLDGQDIETSRLPVPPSEVVGASEALLELIESGEVRLPGWDEAVESYLDRIRRVSDWFPKRGIPVFDEEELGVMRAEIVGHRHRLADMPSSAGIIDVIRSALDWHDAEFVDEMAPLRLKLPGGRSARISWRSGEPPRASARIGDLVGLERTPTVGGGRIPVLMEILAPNRRPVQVTDDLAGFWERTYPGLKKELKRRYPRHPWP